MKLSFVVPCYNEEGNVAPFYKEVLGAFSGTGYDFEIVFVNDGSSDSTLAVLKKLATGPIPVKIVDFSRNFGKEAAVLAGLQNAEGDFVTVIDADLQQHPITVLQMVKRLEENSEIDCVAAYQAERSDSKVLSLFKKAFYLLINGMSETEFKQGASDFRTFRRPMVDAILDMQEYHRFSKGIFSWVGFNTEYMPYVADKRLQGKSKWSFTKLFRYAVDGIEAFSTVPLRLPLIIGILFVLLSLPLFILLAVLKVYLEIAVIFFVGGVILICLGILAEYLAKIYVQGKNRPVYIVRQIINNRDR